MTISAYQQGKAACRNGAEDTANPYTDKLNSSAWLTGFYDAWLEDSLAA